MSERFSLLIDLLVIGACLLLMNGCTTENQKHKERRARLLEMINGMEAELKREEGLPTPPMFREQRGTHIAAKYYEAPVSIVLQWQDCKPQPVGTWYRVYQSIDCAYWSLLLEVTNAYIARIPATNAFAFYVVTSTDGVNESAKWGKECDLE